MIIILKKGGLPYPVMASQGASGKSGTCRSGKGRGNYASAKTVNKWREKYLRDWQCRMNRLNSEIEQIPKKNFKFPVFISIRCLFEILALKISNGIKRQSNFRIFLRVQVTG